MCFDNRLLPAYFILVKQGMSRQAVKDTNLMWQLNKKMGFLIALSPQFTALLSWAQQCGAVGAVSENGSPCSSPILTWRWGWLRQVPCVMPSTISACAGRGVKGTSPGAEAPCLRGLSTSTGSQEPPPGYCMCRQCRRWSCLVKLHPARADLAVHAQCTNTFWKHCGNSTKIHKATASE